MKVKVACAVCGKEGEVEVDDKTGEILSDWAYFGSFRWKRKRVEYWECPECYRKSEEKGEVK